MRGAPTEYSQFSIYNSFFNGLIRFSPTPTQDLREFELDPALQKYSGTTYFQPESAVYDADIYREIKDKVTPSALIKFYLRHPLRIKNALFYTEFLIGSP